LSLDHNFVDGHVCEYQRPSIHIPQNDKHSIFMNMQTVSTEVVAVPHIDAKLNFLQECAHDAIVYLSKLDPADTFSKCMLLTGKGGTGKTTMNNMVTQTLEQCHQVGCVCKLATTRKAADLIGGSTVHNTQRGLALPVGSEQFKLLDRQKLKRFTTGMEQNNCCHY
jgi:midasin (ATPase involved in ribosome maturation)